MDQQSSSPARTSSTPYLQGDNMGSQNLKSRRVSERIRKSRVPFPLRQLLRHNRFTYLLPQSPPTAKRFRLSSPASSSQRYFGKTSPTSDSEIVEVMAELTPHRRNQKGVKLPRINIEQLEKEMTLDSAATDPAEKNGKVIGQRNLRKHKGAKLQAPSTHRNESRPLSPLTPLSGSPRSVRSTPIQRSSTVRTRESVRLLAESYNHNIYYKYPELRFSAAKLQVSHQGIERCASPPLTRSRLKQLLSDQQSQKELQEQQHASWT